MTRIALLLFLALAAGGTFLAVRWLVGDPGGSRQTGRERSREELPEFSRERRDGPANPVAEPRDEPGRRITGFVADVGGNPVPGARISAGSAWTNAGRDGGYALEVPDRARMLRAVARGYLPAELVIATGDERVDFELTRGAVLAGRVTDASGAPVANARVYLVPAEHQLVEPDATEVAETDRNGDYVFPGIEPGVTDVGVRADGYLPKVATDVRIAGLDEHRLDFLLDRGRAVVVQVADPPEGMIPTVRVSDSRLRKMLLPPGGAPLLARALPGRALAAFPVIEKPVLPEVTIRGLPPGPVDFEIVPGRVITAKVGVEHHFVAEPGIGKLLDNTESAVRLRLLPAAIVAPVVRDATTREVLYPKITRFADGKGPLPVDVHVEDKLFLVPTDPRRHVLRFELPGYETRDVELPAGRPAIFDMEVELQPLAGTETGSLKLVFDPKAAGRVGVVGRGEAGTRQFHAKPDADGQWMVEKFPVGTWEVTILASGKVPVRVPDVRIVAGAAQELRVVLHAGGGMELKVTDREGKLLDEVALHLSDAAGERIDIHFVTMVSGERGFTSINYIPSAATARTDSGLAPGTYTLRAGREGYEVGETTFSIAGTEVAEVEVRLRERAR